MGGNYVMNKKKEISIILIAIIIANFMTGCGLKRSGQSIVSSELNIDCSMAELTKDMDSHGGFHGDGTTFYVFQFKLDNNIDSLPEENGWHELPLTDNLTQVVDTLISDSSGEPLFPQVENGYYYFRDRHDESSDCWIDEDIFARYSYNFTFAIYDLENNRLYYCEFDT